MQDTSNTSPNIAHTPKTRKGIVSFYLVTFSALLFGIITMSFYWIMTTETRLASNDDLAQSAYDAALAGIEDAKSVLATYQSCRLKNGEANNTVVVNGQNCANLIQRVKAGFTSGSCDIISNAYSGTGNSANRDNSGGEVQIKESYTNNAGKNTNDEAYTCVKISTDNLTSYRSYLSDMEPSRMIPIENRNVAGIKIQWYSEDTQVKPIRYMGTSSSSKFYDANTAKRSVPILSFDFFQTESSYRLYQLDVNNEENTGADHVMAILYPINGATAGGGAQDTFVTASQLLGTSDLTPFTGTTNSTYDLSPITVKCGYAEGYLCHTVIEFPPTFTGAARSNQNAFIRLALPYGAPTTDFEVTLCDSISPTGSCVNTGATFKDLQAVVDSTGRAGTLYRRLVANIDMMGTGNYANNAIQIYDDGQGSKADINKHFFVTEKCESVTNGESVIKCNDNNKAQR